MDGKKIKRIRWDQALEFYSEDIKKKITGPRGIFVETPGAYAHEQNPKVERMNRTLQTTRRTQCIQAGLPEFFWPEAIRISTLVENHTLTQFARQIGIPVAVLTNGVPPDVSYFRPFGCKVTVTVPPEK